MISKARQIVKDVLDRYYTKHHDKDTFETELTNEVNGGRVGGFSEAKRRMSDAIDHRINKYTAEATMGNGYNANMIRELQLLRTYVKGLVIKVEE